MKAKLGVSWACFAGFYIFFGGQAKGDENLLLDRLHSIEFNQCRSAAEAMANVLVDSGNHGYDLQWGPDDNDDVLVATLENTWDDGSSAIEMGAVAPTTAGDCDIVRTRVLVVNGSCSGVASRWEAERAGALNSKWIRYKTDDRGRTYYMQGVGGQCVVKEVERFAGYSMD